MIQIKHRFSGKVLFEHDGENLKIAVVFAVKSRADLSRADLSRADLSGANLYGANLSGANLSGAKIKQSEINKLSTCPRSGDFIA